MNRKTTLFTATFLGLASLFTADQAMADHKKHDHRDRDQVRFGVQVGTGHGSIVFGNHGVHYQPNQPRVIIERVWVPARYEERTTRVLVHKGHYTEKHTQVLVRPGHYVDKHTQVLVQRGHWTTRYTPPVYRTVTDRYGRCTTVMVKAGCHERVWVPDRYETRCEKVWVPPVYETRCDKIWVPDRYEDRCEKVLIPGHYQEVRREVHDHRHDHGRVNVQISHRGR